MTEYWKSVGNYYCNYCKVFVRDDAFNRRQHEASPRHEGALKRQVRDIHRNSEREARDLLNANRELARIGGKTAEIKKVDEGPKKVNVGARPKKKESTIATLDDSDVYTAALAAQAIPGQWSTVESPTVQPSAGDAEIGRPEVKEEEVEVKLEDDEDGSKVDTRDQDHALETGPPLKRRRDGADEDLIGFTVQTKKTEVPPDDEDADGDSVVAFKRKKKTKVKAKATKMG